MHAENCGIEKCEVITRYKNLEYLNLESNNIKDITPIGKLNKLSILYLSNNPISNLDPLQYLKNLTSLDLENCNVNDISIFKKTTRLRLLNLSNNKINDISFLRDYRNLTILELKNNSIAELDSISDLKKLKTLDIQDNQIEKIPISFFNNTKVEWTTIHTEHLDFNKVNLSGNPIEYPPIEVIRQGRDFINEFYNNSELKKLNECKVILVGRGKVGKTSLQKRLTGGQFENNEPETHGIRKVSWHISELSTNNDINVNIWDFGGQYIQQTLHQFFYSANTVYILVLDKRVDEDPEDFLELIRVYSQNSYVIIVYNNTIDLSKNVSNFDYNLHPEIDSSLKNKYPNIYHKAFGVCCGLNNDIGINNLRDYLVKLIPNLEHVTKKYPANWLDIKDELLKLVKTNYIPFSQYEDLCKSKQIENNTLQQDLAKMLNDIGTITFFDKQFLGHYYILNPDWVTAGAYQIILSTHTNTKKGYINLHDLDLIFSTDLPYSYKQTDYYFILQLMAEFDLCHKFNKDHWLIPSSLGGQSNTDLTTFKNEEYRLYYLEFNISLPSSIIHRFIARNVRYAYNKDYWKNGIVVKHPDSLSFMYVEADRKDRQIRLWIKGERIRDCWEFYRKDFQEFSESFIYSEYVSLDSENNFRVSYQTLLSCLDAGEYKWYMPGFKKIDVLETLGLFTDLKKLETMKKEGSDSQKTENHFHGNLNISGNVGNLASTGINKTSFLGDLNDNLEKKDEIDIEREKLQNEYKDIIVKKWRQKSWRALYIFLIISISAFVWLLYHLNWSLDSKSNKWKAVTDNWIYILISSLILLLLNGIFIKSLYDKYFSYSNIKAFRESIKYSDSSK